MRHRQPCVSLFAAFIVARFFCLSAMAIGAETTAKTIQTVPGMPAVVDPKNLYSETRPENLSPVVAKHLHRVYVPNRTSNDVWVIDPATLKVVDKYKVGINPQHVVPSWDLKTLWVNNNAEGRTDGSVTPIDPLTGKPGKNIPVDDPYNMYFTPDGSAANLRQREAGRSRPTRNRARSPRPRSTLAAGR